MPVDGTWPTGTTQCGEAQPSRSRSRCGIQRSASSATSACWSARTPPSAPRSMTRPDLAGAPGGLQTRRRLQGRRVHGPQYIAAGRARGLHRLLASAWRSARPRTRPQPGHKAIDMAAQPPLRAGRARQLGLLPAPARTGPHRTQLDDARAPSSCEPLFEFSGACAGCGETPYIKLLTQLFGDRPLIANATGLLLASTAATCPPRPTPRTATAAVRPGPTRLFEDNAEFGLGMRLAVRQAPASSPLSCCTRLSATLGDELVTGIADGRPGRRGRHRGPARARRRALKTKARRTAEPEATTAARPGRLPRRRRASGSSAATAGPTTSATAAWTTSSPPAATSTSWCSTPRSTPTPAARPPSPRRMGAVRQVRHGRQEHAARRTSA
jgi:hypothetical protein